MANDATAEPSGSSNFWMSPSEVIRLVYQTAAIAAVVFIFLTTARADIRNDMKLQKTEILNTVTVGLSGQAELIKEAKAESKEFKKTFAESAKDNEDEHDAFVAMIHQLALTIRDFTGLVDSLKKGQGDMLYEVRINRTKIDALFNPDFEEE